MSSDEFQIEPWSDARATSDVALPGGTVKCCYCSVSQSFTQSHLVNNRTSTASQAEDLPGATELTLYVSVCSRECVHVCVW